MPQTAPKRMSREARRAALLDAAEELLRSDRTTLSFESLAEEAGVSPTLPYKYFDSVDELANELYAHLIGPIDDEANTIAADPDRSFDDKLRATMHLWCDVLREDGVLLFRLSDDVAHPSLRRAIDARREGSVELWAGVIEAECSLDPAAARLVAASINAGSIAALRRWIVDRLDRTEMIETFILLARAQLTALPA